jgi:hypothetical protein
MNKFKSKGKERYVMLRYWLLNSAAWKCLPAGARALYIEFALRYNGSNNGRISFSVREAMQAVHVSKGMVRYLLALLQDRGFIICTKRGAFSLKTTKDASEWRLSEYGCDHPPAHATKDFMRWSGDFETMSQFRERKGEPRPKMTDADRERARRLENRTRFTAKPRTVHSHEPHGSQPSPMKPKKRQNGSQPSPIDAQNDPLTVHSQAHLQIPGVGCEPAVLLPFPEGKPAEKKPWSTPTVEEVPWDTLPTEVRMLVLGLPDTGLPPQGVARQPDAVADAPNQAEPRPPADHYAPGGLMDYVNGVIEGQLHNLDEAWKAKRRADQPVSTPDPAPVLVMQDSKEDAGLPPQVAPSAPLVMTYDEEIEAINKEIEAIKKHPTMRPGDAKRAQIAAENKKVVARDRAKMREAREAQEAAQRAAELRERRHGGTSAG